MKICWDDERIFGDSHLRRATRTNEIDIYSILFNVKSVQQCSNVLEILKYYLRISYEELVQIRYAKRVIVETNKMLFIRVLKIYIPSVMKKVYRNYAINICISINVALQKPNIVRVAYLLPPREDK